MADVLVAARASQDDGRRALLADPEAGASRDWDTNVAPEKQRRTQIRRRRAAAAVSIVALLTLTSYAGLKHYQSTRASAEFPTSARPGVQVESSPAPRYFQKAAVSTEVPYCSTVGAQLLQRGGSAVDAAVGSALCVGTVSAFASGIGGGGFMILRAPNGTAEVIDFREVAPRAVAEHLFGDDQNKARIGGLSVGVPGELRGLELAHKRYGKLPWHDVVKPAADMARQGFLATPTLAARVASNKDWILANATWASIYAPNGRPIQAGDTVKRPNFAATLDTIAKKGADAFYSGPIASSLVRAARDAGGVISEQDFSEYQAVTRNPVEIWYKGRRVLAAGAPAAGHVLAYMLNIVERYQMERDGATPLNYHRIVEAMRWGFARRSELGDPSFMDKSIATRLAQIVSKQEAAAARRNISDATTFPPEHYNPKYNAPSHGTTHLSVVDEQGMAVAMTTTVNLIFGSHIMDEQTGVILNDQIDDFSFASFSNGFGLPPSPSNFIQPGKRPMSSTVPTIVETDGSVSLVLGGSGGSRILTAVFQTILNHVDFALPITDAVSHARLHDQLFPDQTEVEEGFSAEVAKDLARKGHAVKMLALGTHESVVQAIARSPDGAGWEAVADYRKGGQPDGY